MSDDRLNELKRYFDGCFAEQDEKLEKCFAHMADELAEVHETVDKIYGAIDAVLKNQEVEREERIAIIARLDRHERWHRQAAKALNLTLGY